MNLNSEIDIEHLDDNQFLEYMKQQEQGKENQAKKDNENERTRRLKIYKLILITYISAAILMFVLFILYSTIGKEQLNGIFQLNRDVLFALNMSVNAFIYALPAFFVACLGSITKILLSQNTFKEFGYVKLLIGSGLIGVLTFLGLKSGIVLDLIIDHGNRVTLTGVDEQKAFYKMIVLCFVTGMFSTTIFLTIEERVSNLANKIKHS